LAAIGRVLMLFQQVSEADWPVSGDAGVAFLVYTNF
jgi:hypothetical protein